MSVSRSRACRLGIALVVASLALAAGAVSAHADGAPPQITLLAPANGSSVSSDAATFPTFSWRVDWAQPPTTPVVYTFRVASDPYFTQNLTQQSQTCPVENPACFTSFSPHEVFSGTYYWQVKVTSPIEAASAVWLFQGVKPVDRTPPKVQALPGSAVRGKRANFWARVSDDSGEVRLHVELLYHGQTVMTGDFGFVRVEWAYRQRFYSKQPLPRALPTGTYLHCITAWDHAGNSARSCASIRIH